MSLHCFPDRLFYRILPVFLLPFCRAWHMTTMPKKVIGWSNSTIEAVLYHLVLIDLRETIRFVNSNLMRLVDSDSGKDMELGSVVLVLDQHLTHNSVHTKVAVLKWIEHLLTRLPESVFTREFAGKCCLRLIE